MITYVAELWQSKNISEDMIKFSFKKCGINLKFDWSEGNYFDWPKNPNMVLLGNLPSLRVNNNLEKNLELDINIRIYLKEMIVIMTMIFYSIMKNIILKI